jgi:hypothetical protein
MLQIDKRDQISYEEFINQYLIKGKPVVLRNASKVWPIHQFGPEFFSSQFGNYVMDFEDKKYSINQILELTKNSTPANPAPYPISFEIPYDLPEFMAMIKPIHMNYATPNWFDSKLFPYGKFGKNVNLFFGGQGNQYSLHKDFYHTNAWITQLYGQKKFILFPGDQDEYLYAGKKGYANFLSPVNILKPDLEKHPKFKSAQAIEVTLEPGETIFVPNGMWHTTVALGQNISVIYDQLNNTNYHAWRKDMFHIKKSQSLVKAVANYGFAIIAGSICKIREFAGR